MKHLFLVLTSAFLGTTISLISIPYFLNKSVPAFNTLNTLPLEQVNYIPTQGTANFTNASSLATPSVVHVKTINTTNGIPNLSGENIYDYFFGKTRPLQPRTSKGSGSGVIVSSDGYIATNYHVIERSTSIEITLSNNKTYKAEIIGIDKDTDLALLKIDEENLPYLSFANSEEVLVGEWVLAVGNPFNLASTVTAGIVSAKGRNIHLSKNVAGEASTAIESFIQTDAAVNPGNSGGALVNLKGELIGIITAIATTTGTFAGYSFAVPANIVSKVVGDLKEFGTVQRAFMGVNIISVDDDIARKLDLNFPEGVLLQHVMEGGAADSAGLQKEDVIIAINDSKVPNVPALQEKISGYRPGNVIKVSFLRKNTLLHATLALRNVFNNKELLSADALNEMTTSK